MVKELEPSKEQLYFAKMLFSYRDCENEKTKFLFKLMQFPNEKKSRNTGLKPIQSFFQRAFQWSRISLGFFEICCNNKPFKSASFLLIRTVDAAIVIGCLEEGGGLHALAQSSETIL